MAVHKNNANGIVIQAMGIIISQFPQTSLSIFLRNTHYEETIHID